MIEKLYTAPPEGSIVVCLDEMGPQAAKSFPGEQPICVEPKDGADGGDRRPAGRAKQEIDYGRRGKGYVFGAFPPGDRRGVDRPLSEPQRRQLGRLPGEGRSLGANELQPRLRDR